MANKVVRITLKANGVPRVNRNAVRIKKLKDQVLWRNKAAHRVTISFRSSPFRGRTFAVSAHHGKRSGKSLSSVRKGRYKYSITVTQTGKKLDPTVIIEN